MKNSDPSLTSYLTGLTFSYLADRRSELDEQAIHHRDDAQDSIRKVLPILHLPEPVKAVQELNHVALLENWDLLTPAQSRHFTASLLSSILCIAPLRRKNITSLQVSTGSIPDAPPQASLHVFEEPQGDKYGRYGLIVPIHELKNGKSSGRLRRLNPPRFVWRLRQELDPAIDHYLNRIRAPALSSEKSGPLFSAGEATLGNWLKAFQARYLVEPLGLERPFAFHPYRAIVATHIIKNALHNPYELAADVLLDTVRVVRVHYARFRPEDNQRHADAITAPEYWSWDLRS